MKSRFAKNLVASILAQLLRYGAPLAFYPYLTRVLGAEGFAQFALAFTLAVILGQLVEFGFGLSGVRALAEASERPLEAAAIAGDVLVGRLVLLSAFALTGLVAWPLIPADVRPSVGMMMFTSLLGVGYGFSSSWYFIGIERAARLALFEVLTSFGQLLLLIVFVRGEGEASLALAMMAVPVWMVSLIGHALALRHLGVVWPSGRRLRAKLAEAFRFFCFTGIMPILNRANLLVLGALASPAQVAWYAVGERIVTAAANATTPIIRVSMPRITKLLSDDPAAAQRLFKRSATFLCGAALVGALVGAAASPVAVPLIFGRELAPGSLVIAIQLFIVPAMMASRITGTMALVPLRQEAAYQRGVLLTSAVGLCAAPVAVWLGGVTALAVLRVAVEGCLASYCVAVLARTAASWILPCSAVSLAAEPQRELQQQSSRQEQTG